MPAHDTLSLEIALGVAGLVLSTRLAAFWQAERGLGSAAERVRTAWSRRDPRATRAALRRLSGRAPFGDFGADWMAALELPAGSERLEALASARKTSIRRVVRRASRGQALDLAALAVLIGLGSFASRGLEAGPVFWGLGFLLVALLIGSVALRGSLGHAIRSTLERLEAWLEAPGDERTVAPSRCESCGAPVEATRWTLAGSPVVPEIEVLLCPTCGHFSGALPPGFRKPAP